MNNRRRNHRHVLAPERGACAEIRFPQPAGEVLSLRVRDVSLGGISVVLGESLPGLEVGDTLKGIDCVLEGRRVRGDLLVMHLTPENAPGALCGGLFYPATDGDLLLLRGIVEALERNPGTSVPPAP